jgi:hypothetical protein
LCGSISGREQLKSEWGLTTSYKSLSDDQQAILDNGNAHGILKGGLAIRHFYEKLCVQLVCSIALTINEHVGFVGGRSEILYTAKLKARIALLVVTQ